MSTVSTPAPSSAITTFFEAVENDRVGTVKKALFDGVDLSLRDERGDTPLAVAADSGSLGVVHLLLEHGADPNDRVWGEYTALHITALQDYPPAVAPQEKENDLDIARALISAGANVNARNERGETPLHLATQENNLPLLKLLIGYGANPTLVDAFDRTALSYAKSSPGLADAADYLEKC